MPSLPSLLAGSMLGALLLYALTAGADFGGGVWNLLARGPRADAQRRLIARAIGPVWETNHIWLIVAVVVLFTGFPPAFAVICTALFIPLTILLAGIVLRGAAFAFYAYHLHEERGAGRWGALFAGASLVTPILLGVTIGAVSSGRIPAETLAFTGDTSSWLAPFPLAVGALTLSVFSYLAAVYLILETEDPDLRADFRTRALWSAATVALLSVFVPAIGKTGAPDFYRALIGSDWFVSIVMFNATAALGAYVSLHLCAFRTARTCAAVQVVLILAGWGFAQFPYLVRPAITFEAAATAPSTMRLLLVSLAAGAVFLFPAIYLLMRIFKKEVLYGRHGRKP